MSKKSGIVLLVITVISLCLGGYNLYTSLNYAKQIEELKKPGAGLTSQYVLYIGTNDKDTYAPKYSEEEAMDIVDKICLEFFEGYTLQTATGSWVDENGNRTHEYTLVCYFDDADPETVHKAADKLIEALNQNTILIESTQLSTEYYSGQK